MEKRTLMLTDLLNLFFKECMDDIKIESVNLFLPTSDYEYIKNLNLLKVNLNRQSLELSDIKISYSIKEQNNVYKPQ